MNRVSKYHSEKCRIDGLIFDSRKEARRYKELCLMLRAGVISRLERQVSFELIPVQRDANRKILERAVTYKADFTYWENGKYIVEDVKSEATRTREYIIKRKLMLKVYGIQIREV